MDFEYLIRWLVQDQSALTGRQVADAVFRMLSECDISECTILPDGTQVCPTCGTAVGFADNLNPKPYKDSTGKTVEFCQNCGNPKEADGMCLTCGKVTPGRLSGSDDKYPMD